MLMQGIGALCLLTMLPGAPNDPPVVAAVMRGDTDAVRALLQQGADANAAQGDGMTPLHWAALRGDVETAQMLIYAGANLKASTRIGAFTPLLLASRQGNAAVIESLISAGGDPNATTANGTPPLHLAAAAGSADAIKILLDHGADVNATEATHGQTALIFAAANNRVEAVDLLLKRGADAALHTTVVDIGEASRAVSAVRREWSKIIAAQREASGQEQGPQRADPTAELRGSGGEEEGRGRRGRRGQSRGRGRGRQTEVEDPTTQLRGGGGEGRRQRGRGGEASQTGQATARAGIEELTAELRRQDLQGRGQRGRGAAAAQQERATSRANADPAAELRGLAAEEPPARAGRSGRRGGRGGGGAGGGGASTSRRRSYTDLVGKSGGLTALLHASRQGHIKTAKKLLEAGAKIDQVSTGDHTSPLLIAIINGRFDLAMHLLQQGANPNIKSHAGVAPLYAVLNVHWAPHAFYPQPSTRREETTHLVLLEALLIAGAEPDVRLEMKVWYTGYNFDQSGVDETGGTAFWRAAQSSDVDALRILIAYGADPTIGSIVTSSRRRRPPGGGNPEEDDNRPAPIPVGGLATTPLHVATGSGFDGNFHRNAPYGWLPAVRYLVDELGFDVNAPDSRGYTPLHNAAFRGDNEMVKYLVQGGGDVMAVARSGQTTVDMANGPIQRLQPYPETIKLLEGMGAKNNHRAVSK